MKNKSLFVLSIILFISIPCDQAMPGGSSGEILSNPMAMREALYAASKNGTEADITTLLKDAVFPSYVILNALNFAFENGHERATLVLLHHQKVDLRYAERSFADTSLWRAARRGNLSTVENLLKDPRLTRYGRNSALCVASEMGHTAVVEKFLAEEEIPAEIRDQALLQSSIGGRVDVVKKLLADSKVTESGVIGALAWARRKGHEEVVENLNAWIEEQRMSAISL